jgi:hypothetical protein
MPVERPRTCKVTTSRGTGPKDVSGTRADSGVGTRQPEGGSRCGRSSPVGPSPAASARLASASVPRSHPGRHRVRPYVPRVAPGLRAPGPRSAPRRPAATGRAAPVPCGGEGRSGAGRRRPPPGSRRTPGPVERRCDRTGRGCSGRPGRSRRGLEKLARATLSRAYVSKARTSAEIPAGRSAIQAAGSPGGCCGGSTPGAMASRMNSAMNSSAGRASIRRWAAHSSRCCGLQSQSPAQAGSSRARLSSRSPCRAATARAAAPPPEQPTRWKRSQPRASDSPQLSSPDRSDTSSGG